MLLILSSFLIFVSRLRIFVVILLFVVVESHALHVFSNYECCWLETLIANNYDSSGREKGQIRANGRVITRLSRSASASTSTAASTSATTVAVAAAMASSEDNYMWSDQ
jgi:uncharacterized membrane protein